MKLSVLTWSHIYINSSKKTKEIIAYKKTCGRIDCTFPLVTVNEKSIKQVTRKNTQVDTLCIITKERISPLEPHPAFSRLLNFSINQRLSKINSRNGACTAFCRSNFSPLYTTDTSICTDKILYKDSIGKVLHKAFFNATISIVTGQILHVVFYQCALLDTCRL